MLFTFPSRYLFTIGHHVYLALGDSTPGFPRGLLASRYSRQKRKSSSAFAYGAVTLFDAPFQELPLANEFLTLLSSVKLFTLKNVHILQPLKNTLANISKVWAVLEINFKAVPFRSPLLRESLRFLFLWLLRCFTSPGWHPLARIYRVHLYGLPHSDILGSQPAQRLPGAYRSHATSFIAFLCLGILRTPLYFSLMSNDRCSIPEPHALK